MRFLYLEGELIPHTHITYLCPKGNAEAQSRHQLFAKCIVSHDVIGDEPIAISSTNSRLQPEIEQKNPNLYQLLIIFGFILKLSISGFQNNNSPKKRDQTHIEQNGDESRPRKRPCLNSPLN
ncbi:hypothetical protein O3G_MSEX008883 [Manduca sexta]|uniref:Uncharacterized protein n=1 Tax=Manduca sexta TaxID=7130 RepID=A0A922CQU8_MANSE|nr:hypothetical protein O3G_MSEX008883 [Manduca sexta]